MAQIARLRLRIYETGISTGRTARKGRLVSDGVRARTASSVTTCPAPLPVLFGGYLIVGGLCGREPPAVRRAHSDCAGGDGRAIAFALAAFLNYWLCVTFLFRHSAKWATAGEVAVYLLVVVVAGGIDWGATLVLIRSGLAPVAAKLWASASHSSPISWSPVSGLS